MFFWGLLHTASAAGFFSPIFCGAANGRFAAPFFFCWQEGRFAAPFFFLAGRTSKQNIAWLRKS
jgi:hypothetical protein